MSAAARLGEGDRCMATISAGLRPQHKKAVITEVLPSGYKVRCDGEEGERRLSEKKVKRLGKPAKPKMDPVSGEPTSATLDAYLEGILNRGDAQRAARDQRPPTRLHIPDANVPAVEPGTPSLIRHSLETDPAFSYHRECARNYPTDAEFLRPQPKPHKPSRSAAYLQHVRQHDCCNCWAPGPSDPDHVGPRGVGQKCSDYETAPLCRDCHRTRTDRNTLPHPQASKQSGRLMLRERAETELILLRAQVQMLREWAEKLEKETP